VEGSLVVLLAHVQTHVRRFELHIGDLCLCVHRVSCAAVAPGIPVKQAGRMRTSARGPHSAVFPSGGMAGASLFRPPVSVGGNISLRALFLAPGARASGEC
jgi:hypothetical protein